MKKAWMLAGAVAALGMLCGTANAGSPNYPLTKAGVVAGAAQGTGLWLLLRDHGTHTWLGSTPSYALTTAGCMAGAPLIGAAFVYASEGRNLTSREAMGMSVGCVLPIIGPMLVGAMFDANPQWEGPAPVLVKHRHARRHARRR